MAPSSQPNVKSSFKGLKVYTEDRVAPLKDMFQWLEAKKRGDNIGNLWRVHDKLYNLEEFIDKHPGGKDWITLTRGADITEAFESCHLVNTDKVQKILEKYYVKDAENPRNAPFTFKEDGFYKTVKRRLEPILKRVGTGPTLTVRAFQDVLALLFILTALVGAQRESILVLILSGVLLHMCATCAHNFFHIRDNWRKYYFDLSLMSSYEWRIQHVLSHHMYTNTLLDFEITVAEPMLYFLPTKSKNWFHRHASMVYSHLIYFTAFFPMFFKRVWNILATGNFRPENALAIVEIFVLMYVAPSAWSGFKSWLLVHAVCCYCLIYLGLVAGHHHPNCLHDGDVPREEPDFGLCQVDATKDKADDFSENLFVNLTTFGDHPMHHLFPAICHSKLPYIKPIVIDTLKEFGVDFNGERIAQLELFAGLHRQYARTEANEKLGLLKDKTT